MANEKSIEDHRTAYANKSEFELIHLMHEWNPTSPMHIAAKQLLEEKRQEEINGKYHEIQRNLEALKKPHRPSFWLLVISVTLAFLALCVAVSQIPQVQQALSQSQKLTEKKELSQQNEQKSAPTIPNTSGK